MVRSKIRQTVPESRKLGNDLTLKMSQNIREQKIRFAANFVFLIFFYGLMLPACVLHSLENNSYSIKPITVLPLEPVPELGRDTSPDCINAIFFSGDDDILHVNRTRGEFQIWDWRKNERSSIPELNFLWTADISCDGHFIGGYVISRHQFVLYSEGKLISTLQMPEPPNALAFHPFQPSLLATGDYEHWLRVWDIKSSELIYEEKVEDAVVALDFSPDGQLLAVGTQYYSHNQLPTNIRIYQVSNWELLSKLNRPIDLKEIEEFDIKLEGMTLRIKGVSGVEEGSIAALTFVDGKHIAAAYEDGSLALWNWVDDNMLWLISPRIINKEVMEIYGICYHIPSNCILAISSNSKDEELLVRNVADGKLVRIVESYSMPREIRKQRSCFYHSPVLCLSNNNKFLAYAFTYDPRARIIEIPDKW